VNEEESDSNRQGNSNSITEDRSRWKTLRDFVDERGLEDVFESVEGERNALDETLATTAAHPLTIMSMIDRIRALLSNSLSNSASQDTLPTRIPSRMSTSTHAEARRPVPGPLSTKDITAHLMQQEHTSTEMARHLESLALHYDQMATALKEKEAGQELEAEDMERRSVLYQACHCSHNKIASLCTRYC